MPPTSGSRNELRVAVAQPEWSPADLTTNIRRHVQIIATANAQLVVFPQLSLCGYNLWAEPLAISDARLEPLRQACADHDATALVGALVRDVHSYIATLVVRPDGIRIGYRKMHLHGPEPSRLRPGPEPVAVEVAGWRLGLAICRDTGVMEHADSTLALGVDAYVGSALFSRDETQVRDQRMRSIARHYGVWTLLSNAAGPTGSFGEACGGSGVWDPDGELVAQASRGPGDFVQAVLTRGAVPARTGIASAI